MQQYPGSDGLFNSNASALSRTPADLQAQYENLRSVESRLCAMPDWAAKESKKIAVVGMDPVTLLA
jgi:hypothetical protein